MKRQLLIFTLSLASLTSFAVNDFKVHEWGTFTSVQGSDGVPLAGLEVEEEALPAFIHNRDSHLERSQPTDAFAIGVCKSCPGHCCKGECCDNLRVGDEPLQVTQKMETPVLYFYSAKAHKVDVTVDFPKGIISQYFPMPSTFLPALRTLGLQGGQIHYAGLEILPEYSLKNVPPVATGNVYAPARVTDANLVRANGETEKFIFYRGLGNFTTSLKVTSDEKSLALHDTLGNGIPFLLALNVKNGKANFKVLGNLAAGQKKSFAMQSLLQELAPTLEMGTFEKRVSPVLVAALEKSGLYPLEARSMVNTWRVSYFHTEGLRILYVLPRAETDAILPIRISPEPQELVRTLVGRVEVMTKLEENSLLSWADVPQGRFQAAKLSRLKKLSLK
jgi:hypothetical protein